MGEIHYSYILIRYMFILHSHIIVNIKFCHGCRYHHKIKYDFKIL